jgi:hypothetical protein
VAKYALLESHLRTQPWDELPMTFSDIERVIGSKLPPAAHRHRAWWSNNPANNVMTKAWLNAGFRSEQVDLDGQRVVFRRIASTSKNTHNEESAMAEAAPEFPSGSTAQPKHHPLLGRLKGMVVHEVDFDLCGPAMPEWADLLDQKYGPPSRQ